MVRIDGTGTRLHWQPAEQFGKSKRESERSTLFYNLQSHRIFRLFGESTGHFYAQDSEADVSRRSDYQLGFYYMKWQQSHRFTTHQYKSTIPNPL